MGYISSFHWNHSRDLHSNISRLLTSRSKYIRQQELVAVDTRYVTGKLVINQLHGAETLWRSLAD
jgi:hypothetical protein